MSLRDHLQDIYDRNRYLSDELVVETATDEAHPLHDRFEWDDAVAGHEYRLSQARVMIRSVKIIYKKTRTGPKTVRQYHATRGVGAPAGVYRSVDDIADDPIAREVVLAEMRREWEAFKRRYQHLAEFFELIDAERQQAA